MGNVKQRWGIMCSSKEPTADNKKWVFNGMSFISSGDAFTNASLTNYLLAHRYCPKIGEQNLYNQYSDTDTTTDCYYSIIRINRIEGPGGSETNSVVYGDAYKYSIWTGTYWAKGTEKIDETYSKSENDFINNDRNEDGYYYIYKGIM